MPNLRLSDEQITEVIAFLTWVSHIDNQNWPPRPIVVTAALPQGIILGAPPGPHLLIPWPSVTPCSAGRRRPVSVVTRSRRAWSWSGHRLPACDARGDLVESELQRFGDDATGTSGNRL